VIKLSDLHERHAREERRLLLGRLDKCGWSPKATARTLDVSEAWVRKAIDKYGLAQYRPADAPEHRGRPRKAKS
jgi:transposase